jgi:hypothetical protein
VFAPPDEFNTLGTAGGGIRDHAGMVDNAALLVLIRAVIAGHFELRESDEDGRMVTWVSAHQIDVYGDNYG